MKKRKVTYCQLTILILLSALAFPLFSVSQKNNNFSSSDTIQINKYLKLAEQNVKINPDSAFSCSNKILSLITDTTNRYYLQAEYTKGQILYFKNKRDSAIYYFSKFILNSKIINDIEKKVRAYNYIGLCYMNSGKYEKAVINFQKSIKISEDAGLKYREGAALNNLSLVYSNLSLYDKSFLTLTKSLKIFQELKDTIAITKTLNNMGLLNQAIKDYKTAEDYFLKTLALANKNNNIELKSTAYINLGNLYKELKKYDKAIEYLKKTLPLLKILKDNEKTVESYTFIGEIYFKLNRCNEALDNYYKALNINKNGGPIDFKILILNNIAQAYIMKGNIDTAYIYISKMQNLLNKNSEKFLNKDFFKTLSLYYEKKHNYYKSLKYYKRYSEIKDSLTETKFNEKVAKQKTLFESNLKQKKINSLNAENTLNKLLQKQQSAKIKTITIFIIASVIIILFALFFILYIFRQLKVKNRLYESIKRNRKVLLEKNQEIIQQNEEIKSQTEQLYQINEDLMQLKTAIDGTDNAVVILDKDGNFEWGNTGFDRLYDITFNEFIKKYPNILDASKKSSNYAQMSGVIKNTIKNKTSGNYEFSTLNNKGNKIWIKTSIKAITDLKGEIQSIIVIDTDITDKVTTGRLLEIKNHELEKQKEEINSSLRYAKTIQNAILPTPGNMRMRNDFFLIYLPKDIVSGDFYWFSAKEDPFYTYYAVVDCTGHGVPGAFMSMIGARLLNHIINEQNIHLPSEILEQMNTSVKIALKQKLSGNKDGMDISLIRLEKTPDNEIKIVFSGAKQSVFIYNKQNKSLTKIRGDIKTIGGYFDDDIPFTNKKIIAKKDDIIYLLSDGIIDQNSLEGKKIGTSGFYGIIQEIADLSLTEQKEKLTEVLNIHKKGINQRDDITILGIKIE